MYVLNGFDFKSPSNKIAKGASLRLAPLDASLTKLEPISGLSQSVWHTLAKKEIRLTHFLICSAESAASFMPPLA